MFWRKKIAFLNKILLCCSVSLKDKSFKIDKRVTVDCIPSIDMHHSTTYSRAKVKKVFSAIFDEFFERKLKEKDFKLCYYLAMDYDTTPETEHKLYGLVLRNMKVRMMIF